MGTTNTTTTTLARVSRWAPIVLAILIGATLLATVWSTRRAVRSAYDSILRGQAALIQDGVRVRLFELGAPNPTDADLSIILDDMAPDGVRYLATVDPASRLILARAGTPLDQPADLVGMVSHVRPGMPVEIGGGERVRVVVRGAGRRGLGRVARRRRWAGFRRLAPMVIEFEPRVATDLRTAANHSMEVGAAAAGGLLLVALVLFRWVRSREALERRLQHERRLVSLGQMSAVLAHEIRNPLASLKGNAQLLARGLPEGERPRAKAERVVDEAVRLEALTNDLLEFARTGALHREATDPGALLREVAGGVAPPPGGAGEQGRIDIDAASAPPTWLLDRGRIRQVLDNLLHNAIQAGGPVVARVALDRDRLVYTVRDHGSGIPPEDLDRIFEPFFTRRTRGTGLGLAVARRIAELHGGTLTADNASGGGAEFRMTIPRD